MFLVCQGEIQLSILSCFNSEDGCEDNSWLSVLITDCLDLSEVGLIDIPSVFKEVVQWAKPVLGGLKSLNPNGKNASWKTSLISFFIASLCNNHKLFPPVSIFFLYAFLLFHHSCPVRNFGWEGESSGDQSLPDPAFLEIMRGSGTRSLVPLVLSTNKTPISEAFEGESLLFLASTGCSSGTSPPGAVGQ